VVNLGIAMKRRRRDTQPLRAAGNRRIVDGLDVYTVFVQQPVADLLARHGIAHHHRHDVTVVRRYGTRASSNRRLSLATRCYCARAPRRSPQIAHACQGPGAPFDGRRRHSGERFWRRRRLRFVTGPEKTSSPQRGLPRQTTLRPPRTNVCGRTLLPRPSLRRSYPSLEHRRSEGSRTRCG